MNGDYNQDRFNGDYNARGGSPIQNDAQPVDLKNVFVAPLNGIMENELGELNTFLGELRDTGISSEIETIPIVVLGDVQTCKSSVIRELTGIPLPIAKGLCTRCPIVLHLNKSRTWYCQISTGSLPSDTLHVMNPSHLSQAIFEAQSRVAGSMSKRISAQEITIQITAPNLTNMTVIDLPGIARVPLEGQADDTQAIVLGILESYIKNTNSLIMCTVTAEVDAAVNESLKLAKQWDPTGERTIGVVTKPNNIPSDDDKRERTRLIKGDVFPLKHGFIMVKTYSSSDNNPPTNSEEAVRAEKRFFETDRILSAIDKTKVGIQSLAKAISKLMVTKAKTQIPSIKDKVVQFRLETQREIAKIPPGPPEDNENRKAYFVGLIYKFEAESYKCVVQGDARPIKKHDSGNSFTHWRKLYADLSESISNLSNDMMDGRLTESYFEQEIYHRQANALDPMFIHFDMIKDPVKDLLKSYIPPAQTCVLAISHQLCEIMKILVQTFFASTPRLRTFIEDITNVVRLEQETITKDQIMFHLKEEKAVYTQSSLITLETDKLNQAEPIDVENVSNVLQNARKSRRLTQAYLLIMNRRLSDQIPMCIQRCMHWEYVKALKNRLHQVLQSEEFYQLAVERDEIGQLRYDLQERLTRLLKGETRLMSL